MHGYHEANSLLGFVLTCMIIMLYFLPSWIAYCRNHRNRFALFLCNLLLGWTAIFWIGSLIWSVWNSKD